jgi:hypothetical protein
MKRSLFIQMSCLTALLLLFAGCSRAGQQLEEAIATPEPTRYINEAGGFALDLPGDWRVDEQGDTALGMKVDLVTADDETAGTVYYSLNRTLDRDQLAADLCPDCAENMQLTESSLNGQPSWEFETVGDDGTAQQWTIVENGDALVAFSFTDASDLATQTSLTESLRFTPVIDGAGRTAEMAEAMRLAIAERSGASDADVAISAVEEMTWPDACLGAPLADEMCAAVETPGYRVTIQAPDGEYVFHFDPTTTQIRLAAAPAVEIGRTLLEWRSSGFPCETVLVGADGIAFGACESPALLAADWGSPARRQLLDSLLAALAPFNAETPAGLVRFDGRGTREATPTEQRQLAELARLASASGIEEGAQSPGVAMVWRREAREPNACDRLALYMTGEVVLGSCADGADTLQPAASLTLEELVQLYTWLDVFEGGEIALDDADNDAGLGVSATLNGIGFEPLSAADAAPLLIYAASVFGERAATAGLTRPAMASPPGCPEPTAETALLAVPGLGLCLLYPADYVADQPLPGQAVIAVDSLLNLADPRVEIAVEPAAGRTLEEAVTTARETGFYDDDPAAITLGGEPAALLTSSSESEPSREALVIAHDRLYRLLFTALSAEDATSERLEALENLVLDTFTPLE